MAAPPPAPLTPSLGVRQIDDIAGAIATYALPIAQAMVKVAQALAAVTLANLPAVTAAMTALVQHASPVDQAFVQMVTEQAKVFATYPVSAPSGMTPPSQAVAGLGALLTGKPGPTMSAAAIQGQAKGFVQALAHPIAETKQLIGYLTLYQPNDRAAICRTAGEDLPVGTIPKTVALATVALQQGVVVTACDQTGSEGPFVMRYPPNQVYAAAVFVVLGVVVIGVARAL